MRSLLFSLIVLLAGLPCRAELGPDNLLLLVNKNVPEGQRLAEFYAKAREVPPGRILALPLPVAEEMGFATYERDVVPAVREYLRTKELEGKVTCIVTMFGTPLRIGAHQLTPDEAKEIAQLKQDQGELLGQIRGIVSSLEAELRKSDPSFAPMSGDDPEHVIARAEQAMKATYQQIGKVADAQERSARLASFVKVLHELMGPAGVLRSFDPRNDPNQTAEQKAKYQEALAQVQAAVAEIGKLQEQRHDPAARALLRKMIGESFGKVEQLRIAQVHAEYLNPDRSVSSFDSELALLWFPNYARPGWQANPMHYGAHPPARQARVMMVMRLDAPQSGMVREMILAGLRAERDGLKGRLVLDSRGISAQGDAGKFGSYGWYDQSIRNLAALVSSKTKLSVLHEDSPDLLGAGAAQDVALYCGWYSVRNYVPCCHFNPGAVAFHVASFELVSLKNEGEKGWCRGLLTDGAAATLGPVAEPYLAAFPAADDFFPLLMTGKLPLAAVYWKTAPFTSWMISMIGDPLYTPYKVNPPLKAEDLPPRLKAALTAGE